MKSKKMFVVLLTAVLLFSLYILASRTDAGFPTFWILTEQSKPDGMNLQLELGNL